MHQQISKKIFVYCLFLFLLGSINNFNLKNFINPKINRIDIIGLENENKFKLMKNLNFIEYESLFFLKKEKLRELINSISTVEKFYIYKKYPSTLEIRVDKTQYLARINKNDKNYFIGSNGKLIDFSNQINNVPFIFGALNVEEFLRFKTKIDQSRFNYDDIKNLFFFPSERWDIETKKGILIKLPKENVIGSLNLSYNVLNDKNFFDSKIIDLRINNQVIIDGK